MEGRKGHNFCYLNCNSSIYIFVFIIFVTCSILNSSFSFYYSNVRLCFHHFNFSIFIAKFHDFLTLPILF